MGRAKEIIVKVIDQKTANEFVKKFHYSGKVVQNSKLHFGCFLDNKLGGVMSYGSPIDKSKVLPLVETSNKEKNTKWNEMLELNRMAFSDLLPRNSESRCISISIKLLKKNAPQIKWILSFSDGTQCGDGTIYRASGFKLTGLNSKSELLKMPNGEVKHRIAMHTDPKVIFESNGKNASVKNLAKKYNAEILNGFQLRYIYLIDPTAKLNVKTIPFSEIDNVGAGMYKGKKITLQERKVINVSDKVVLNSASNLED